MTCRLDRIVGARELATAVAACIRSAQDEAFQGGRRRATAPTSNWVVIDSWWLPREEESSFCGNMAFGGITMHQWMDFPPMNI